MTAQQRLTDLLKFGPRPLYEIFTSMTFAKKVVFETARQLGVQQANLYGILHWRLPSFRERQAMDDLRQRMRHAVKAHVRAVAQSSGRREVTP